MPLLAVMSDLDLIESPSADQARTCLKLVFAASHTMIFERQVPESRIQAQWPLCHAWRAIYGRTHS